MIALEAATDRQLLERFRAGKDQPAFAELVRRHGRMVMNVCRRVLREPHDADDAFQATFLLLARKAGSILHERSVAGWLYGVAFRTALKARARAALRRKVESRVAAMQATETASRAVWDEVGPALDQELSRLPENFRLPLVLCDLEGKPHEQAAEQLGCPRGTIWKRLVRGREMLRERLVHRGVVVTSALLVALLAKYAAAATVAPAVVGSTVKAAALAAAGTAGAAALVSANVDILVNAGLKAMVYAKMKVAATVLVSVTVLGAGGGIALSRHLQEEPPPPPERKTVALTAKRQQSPIRDFDGLVRMIKPQEDEAYWLQIPWMLDSREAQKKAAAEGKPLFLWGADGEPMGFN